ncbi:hypothetical protein [Legionella waltersii]|uniref:Uncharacterized protein n=1 Tax=Legionella waltersii TaxID=66969 RepID=A0A0W1ABU8_9GAMM|nr:hypothetical protein [Legionella waltersii]KTD78821.1 hypothetical protein Lwal_1591 [Legionella waltersii]SNV10967.1 Uncharacterised protein [Legionella waltersii]
MFSKSKDDTIVKVQVDTPNTDDSVTVYVWSSGLNSLGHVSMKFSDDPRHYWSIWPKSTPAGGLTSIFPLQATLAPKLEDDCMQEAIRPREDFANLMQPVEIIPQQPDKVFVVRGLDKEKMINEFNRIAQGLETGDVSYQLLPGVKLVNTFTRIMPMQPKEEVYNCVTLTGHLLKVGGKSNLNCNPWETPSNFADQLGHLDQTKLQSTSPAGDDEKPANPVSKPTVPASVSIRNRLTSRWFTDDYYDENLQNSRDLTPPSSDSESQETEASSDDTPSHSFSDSSFSFFDRGNDDDDATNSNQRNEDSPSVLQQNDDESDSRYLSRVDAMVH